MNMNDIKSQLRSFCRRNRSSLKETLGGEFTAEEICELIIERLGIEEAAKIINDINLIERRRGNTAFYLILIVGVLKAYESKSTSVS